MTLIQYYAAASLDGYIAGPNDEMEWLTEYEGTYAGDAAANPMGPGGSYERFYEQVGVLVSGSTTYEWVLAHIGEATETGGSGWPYPGKPFWVLSSRDLPIPGFEGMDVRVAAATVSELHPELVDAADGRNIWIVGGGGVASQFAEAGLLDELHVTIVPVVLGAGKPLFERPVPPMQLEEVAPIANGMVELRYTLKR